MNRCTAKLHFAITLLLFVITPAFNILVYITMLSNGTESGLLFSYMTFYAIVSSLILLSFFTLFLEELQILKQEYMTVLRRGDMASKMLDEKNDAESVNVKEEEINKDVL